jgi:hypothetical protein
MKEHLTEDKAIEMLGKSGIVWDKLSKIDFEDVDDVDDVIVSGGQREEEVNTLNQKQQSEAISSLTANPLTLQELSPKWIVKSVLKTAGFADEDIQEALDKETDPNRQLMQEADEAIQEIMVGKTPKLNRGANTAFMQRILNWDMDNIDWVKLDKNGNEIGVDEKMLKIHQNLMAYLNAHQQIVIQNQQRELMKLQASAGMFGGSGAVKPPVQGEEERQQALARPFEAGGTPEATAQTSQQISETVSP